MGAIKVFLKEVVLPIALAFCLASFLKPIYMPDGVCDYFLMWICVGLPFGIRKDVPLARSKRLRHLRLSRHFRIELNHRRSHRRTRLLHRAAARYHSYHPRNHLNYIVNEEGLFLLQFGVRSKPSFFVAQKPEYLLAMRRKKGVFKHETHDSR